MKPGMTFLQYVRDRIVIICTCFIAIAIALLVVWLDLSIGQRFAAKESLIYIFVLAVFILMIGLVYDYTNQRRWYKEMYNAETNTSDSDFTLCLQHPSTLEQKRMHALLSRQYRSFMNELLTMRNEREKHVHFTNQWVHHMKTPVSVIHLLTQQPAYELDQSQVEILLRSVSEEADRITRGLDMMLSTARLDKFEMDLHVSGLKLKQVIRQVVNENKKSLIKHKIFPKIESDDVVVDSDEKWLNFVLTQLVTNSIKYMRDKEGSKSLTFKTEREDDSILLHVQDEGIGIAPEDLPRVFDAFFTGQNGRKEGDATGMGLYLVKQVCAKLGHSIHITSKLHEGTTVTIKFESRAIHHQLLERLR